MGYKSIKSIKNLKLRRVRFFFFFLKRIFMGFAALNFRASSANIDC